MTETTLTIGIPTYNRCEAVIGNVTHLQNSKLPKNVKILVIDNASSDESYQNLLRISNPETTRILRNDENIGFSNNFLKLFRKCNTEYLFITSDEDYVITENLQELLEFIKTTSADFISSQSIIDGKVYQGRAKIRPINLSEYRTASNYVSGITYKVSSCLEKINKIDRYIEIKLEIALLYPQILLSGMILLSGNAYWYNKPLCNKVFQLPSEMPNTHGRYYCVVSRWIQYSSQIDFFLDLLNDPEYHSVHHKILKMLEWHLNTLKSTISSGIVHERSDIPGIEIYLDQNPLSSSKLDIVKKNSQYHFQIISQFSLKKLPLWIIHILRKSLRVTIVGKTWRKLKHIKNLF